MMKLYGFGPTRTLRALWGLKELGLKYEFIPVNLIAGEHRRPEFLAPRSARSRQVCLLLSLGRYAGSLSEAAFFMSAAAHRRHGPFSRRSCFSFAPICS